MTSFIKKFVQLNIKICDTLEVVLPSRLRQDGNNFFLNHTLVGAVSPNSKLFDMGSGSQPFLSPERKKELQTYVVGLDIDQGELKMAPSGSYDEIIVHDLCTYVGSADADTVICQATLEHVPDTAGAITAIASTLKPGGKAYIFAPSRNAVFARLNLALPESVKRRLLFAMFPQKADGHHGFIAHYDQCTPSEISSLAKQNGLDVERRDLFWISSYFKAFVPVYLIWRLYQLFAWLLMQDDAAETFIFVLRRNAEVPAQV